jgi:CRP-like cAMP-binding protein
VDADGNDKVVAKLTSGNYFGEIALLTTKPRQATVKAAEGQLCVLAIDRATFIRVFGNLDELMKRNMEVKHDRPYGPRRGPFENCFFASHHRSFW